MVRPVARVVVLVNIKPKLVRQVVKSVKLVNLKILDLKLCVIIVGEARTVGLAGLPVRVVLRGNIIPVLDNHLANHVPQGIIQNFHRLIGV